jgi:dethiobiotin synthetase
MTPILKDYFVTDLIKAMNLETIIITRSRIGTVNHTIMTCNMCKQYGIKITGIVINNFDSGYSPHELQRDLEEITDVKVLGIIPYIEKITIDKMMRHVEENIDLKLLI